MLRRMVREAVDRVEIGLGGVRVGGEGGVAQGAVGEEEEGEEEGWWSSKSGVAPARRLDMGMPTGHRYMLVAAYLCSATHPSDDAGSYGGSGGGGKRRKSRAGFDEDERWERRERDERDRPVPTERIMSVFDVIYGRGLGRAVGGGGHGSGTAAMSAIGHLSRLGWMQRVHTGRGGEQGARYRCRVPRDVAEDAAKSVDFDIDAYAPK